MSLNVGSATATLNLDISAYQKNMTTASEKYREFIAETQTVIGFEGTSQALAELSKMIGELARLEDWSVDEKIAGYESVQALYQNNARQQMQLELELHSLRKAQQQEILSMEMERIDRMNTGYAKTTDYAAMIEAYGQLKTAAEGNAQMTLELEDKIAEAARARQDKVTEAKKEEVDSLLKENERRYQAERALHEDDLAYTASYYQRQIALNRQMIDELLGESGTLTKKQESELTKRLDAEADYYAKIRQMTNEAAAERQKAEEAITEAVREAAEAREGLDAEYNARVAQTQKEARDNELKLMEDYEQKARAVNERLLSDERRLTEAYEKTLAARQESLMNFVGLFNSVSVKDVSGEQLMANLEGQVDAMKRFEESLQSLKSKGISEDLYGTLEGMGSGRYQEVEALDALSQEQLAAYQTLYDEKARIARQQAEAQLAEQRQALDADIQKLRSDAANQLNQLSEDYGESMRQLNEKTREALGKLNADWQASVAEIEDSLQKEIEAQETVIAKSIVLKTGYYKQEAQAQKKTEQEKTDNVRRECVRQEAEVRTSQNNIVSTLRQFIPSWETVGRDFGNALLAGVQSTRVQIQNYMNGILNAIQQIQEGAEYVSIRAYAQGTASAAQGLALVGEAGPEIVDFSGGEQVVAFQDSLALLSEGAVALNQTAAAAELFARNALYTPKDEGIDYGKLAKALAAALPKQTASIVYNPVYNSPKAESVSELKRQDKINMRRLGLSLT